MGERLRPDSSYQPCDELTPQKIEVDSGEQDIEKLEDNVEKELTLLNMVLERLNKVITFLNH